MSNKRLTATVRGYVQGVGYRYFAAMRAGTLGLVGYVRNRDSEQEVEVVAEGPEKSLREFVGYLEAGPIGAYVTGVQPVFSEPTMEFHRFEVRH